MKEIESNKKAWSLVSEDHYNHYKKSFEENSYLFNPIVLSELGDVSGKKILHLQCNTGADSIVLAKMGAQVTGVDLVPENIYFAEKLANDLGVANVDFFECDIMALMDNHIGKYDIIFTSDGCIGWLPDLKKWGKTIRYFLKDDGFFYVHDSHPFYYTFDEVKIRENIIEIKYPYFGKEPDVSNEIGGYASDYKEAENYFWMYTVSQLVNAIAGAGLFIEYFNEYDRCAQGMGGSILDKKGLSYFPHLEGKLPLVFSLKATVR
ncbi:methyltransferase family protein [Natranaerovirga pectinivora]|uniref:Methyltransferase family protein n=1 Tax=Natranaerovirga pectinivora TaxID=682400 RepID=A0A4V2V0I2_9FIRM|nr:class I SAM-dependent methyltransferase [Natranaerovirga pectinivora]TCT16217.1 methyltransferase family protein [Natranaerovirga pectinivora]